ncbi:MAG TPA: TonB-dependent receptor [Gemmatimonadales bacterium]|nr:TonB-dependent receptor [Gemmatimonadales bacterium]
MSRHPPLVLALLALLALPLAAQVPDSVVPTLPDITVVTRAPAPPSLLPRALGVLDSVALRRGRVGTGLAETLNELPGVFAADRGTFALDQRVSIRGAGSRAAFGTRGVTVLLDGVPQTLPDGQSQLTNVDLTAIDRVEVLRGSSSALYGNGAGGVVSLTSARAADAPLAGRARIVGGAFGLLTWNGWGSARHGPLSGTASLSRTTLDGFREHSAADLRQLGLSGAYDGAATRLALHFSAADDPRADNPGALTPAEYAAQRDAAAPNNLLRNAGKDVTQQQLSVQLAHNDTHGNSLELTTFGLRRNLRNPLASNTLVSIGRRVGGVRALATHHPAASSLPVISLGADAQWLRDDRRNVTPNAGTPNDTTLNQLEYVTEIGPFARATWTPAPSWLLEAGLRYDLVKFRVRDRLLADGRDDSGRRSMSAWSGSGGVSRVVARWLVPYANVTTSYETPTTTELAVQQTGAGGFNQELGPQRTTTLELGARGATDRLQWSVAVYQARIRDAIVPFEESDGRSFHANAGRIRNRGLEASASVRLLPHWTAQAAWTWSDYRFTDYKLVTGSDTTRLDGHRLAGLPRSALHMGIRGTLGYAWVALDQSVASSVWGDDDNTIPVDGWQVTDFRAGASLTLGATQLSPFVGVNNLWNARYVGSVTINGAGGRVLEPSPGRNVYVGLELGAGS